VGFARPFVYLIIKEWKKVKYFLAFVLLATFIARKKLLRMLENESRADKDMTDSVLPKDKPRK